MTKLTDHGRQQLENLASRLSDIATPDRFTALPNGTLEWRDDEGMSLELYGPRMIRALLMLDNAALEEWVITTTDTRARAKDQAHKYSYERGRREIISTVHELLGIDKLTRAIDALGPV